MRVHTRTRTPLFLSSERARKGSIVGVWTSEVEAFEQAFALVDAAERWGLDALWLAELHFSPQRSVLSAPLTVASAIAARTERIKIGTAVQVLPLCHPLQLAEEAATVDHLSHGRLIFGVVLVSRRVL
jgi:alkanesulfonate monooxygenase SsuD/methylene tetrahydromethanopterin reductase-like flavin-dependent oxidoreductase (luciferase family)